jgi:hypothetical protein
MPLVRTALIATAACLLGAAAYAQPTDQAPPASLSQPAPAPSSDMSTPAPTGAAANTSATMNASGVQVIASQPVPDTPANRAAFGQPLSHAGKHTKPAGN